MFLSNVLGAFKLCIFPLKLFIRISAYNVKIFFLISEGFKSDQLSLLWQ
jgi:hypothetical protein